MSVLRVDHINVGHGDTSLVELPDGAFMLVDCNVTEDSEALGMLKERIPEKDGVREIDILVVTHPDADHITGLPLLEDNGFAISSVWESGFRFEDETDRPEYAELLDLIERVKSVKLPTGRQPRQAHGVDVYTLCSCESDEDYTVHYSGLVLKIAYAGRAVLFAGDSGLDAWKDKIVPNCGPSEDGEKDNLLAANYLHASHHGSRSFFVVNKEDDPYLEGLELISPDVTVISGLSRADTDDAGNGEQDWPPHNDAVELYEQYSGEVLITGEYGTVTFEIDDTGTVSRDFSKSGVEVRMGHRVSKPTYVAPAVIVPTPKEGPKPWGA